MIKFDVPADSPPGQIKVIVCLCVMPKAERFGGTLGLALVPTRTSDEYRRVGLFLGAELSWWDRCAERTITIV